MEWIKCTYNELFICQNVLSSEIHGLDGFGATSMGSYSVYVSENCIKLSNATETLARVLSTQPLRKSTCW